MRSFIAASDGTGHRTRQSQHRLMLGFLHAVGSGEVDLAGYQAVPRGAAANRLGMDKGRVAAKCRRLEGSGDTCGPGTDHDDLVLLYSLLSFPRLPIP
jgi:hypothetical protein